jgi:hypothetical protein
VLANESTALVLSGSQREKAKQLVYNLIGKLGMQDEVLEAMLVNRGGGPTKTYIFRPYGQDGGDLAELTTAQARQIQKRLDALEDEHGDRPYYLYEMGHIWLSGINALLDDEEPQQR